MVPAVVVVREEGNDNPVVAVVFAPPSWKPADLIRQ